METLDCKGMVCPKPLILTKKTLSATKPGDSFLVIIDNDTSRQNVKRFCQDNGCDVAEAREKNDYVLTVTKRSSMPGEKEFAEYCSTPQRKHVICFKSDAMGVGPAELGTILMKAFINTIKECSPLPGHCVCYNSGVTLAVQGSPLVEPLKALENCGVKILVCGTCLDYFQIKNKLSVGTVSNMFTILETLNAASHVITP